MRLPRRLTAWGAALAVASAAAIIPASVADAATLAGKTVDYHGYHFTVPVTWPVIDLTGSPRTCVEFSRHALYLGTPSDLQNCPARVFGKSEAVLVEPGAATAPTRTLVDSVSQEITASAPRITVSASYGSDKAQVTSILESAGLAPPTEAVRQAARVRAAASTESASATTFTGEAFDTCDAPSEAAMNAWKSSSPYSAIGIYIGGVNRSCPESNLTASWVSTLAASGWHFFLLYVGPQDPDVDPENCSPCTLFTASSAQSDAVNAAQDAGSQAAALGFGSGTPIFYDMESYSTSGTSAALSFATSWTTDLHSLGYLAGEYSGGASGITDIVNNLGTEPLPDMIDVAHWNNDATTSDSYVPSDDWTNHQRIHQYAGEVDASYGGYSFGGGIDEDYMDVASGSAAAPEGILELHKDGSIWSYTGTPITGWTELDNNAKAIQTAESAGNTYELHNDGTIWSYTGTPITGWTKIGNNSAAIKIAASGDHLYELDSTGTIWSYTGTPITGWTKVADNVAAKSIAATQSNLYELDSTGTIWSYTGTPITGWTKIDDNTATVGLTANAATAYELHKDGSIWQYNGTPITGWTKIGNNVAAVSVRAASNGTLYELDSTGTIWQYNGTPITGWTKVADNVAAKAISLGYDNTLYELDSTGTIWSYTGTPITGWTKIDDNTAAIAIDSGADDSAHL